MSNLKVLSLFSGIGAFEKGLCHLGVDFELVNYCEFDKHASKAYSLIHNVSEDLNLGDITKVDETKIPDFDLMTYGFPCQSFSMSGNRLGFDDPNKGNLFFESMRIVKHKKPKYLIAENVIGLLTHDGGSTFRKILTTLSDLGYTNYHRVLISSDFDIPQSRERIFIVSIRKDIDQHKFVFPKGQMTTKRVADIIDHTETTRYITKSMKPFLDTKYHKNYNSPVGIKKVFHGHLQKECGSRKGIMSTRILSITGISPTIMASSSADSSYVELGGQLNGLEVLRLQGFDDSDYDKIKNVISQHQIKKQAGNSITVNVVQAIQEYLFLAQGIPHPNQMKEFPRFALETFM